MGVHRSVLDTIEFNLIADKFVTLDWLQVDYFEAINTKLTLDFHYWCLFNTIDTKLMHVKPLILNWHNNLVDITDHNWHQIDTCVIFDTFNTRSTTSGIKLVSLASI